ncbi:MAG: hypothetical protein R2716_06245 [Microthrixaceae bacterium]
MSDPDIRTDALTRARAVIVPSRQKRPNMPGEGSCPFCPGGLEAPEGDYEVKWFPNRWPAMDGGRCEMVLYTPEHDLAFWELGPEGALAVVDLWAERTAALGGRPDVEYVLVFENRGPEVGATIPHPHGQIYAYAEVPPTPLRELTDGVLELVDADDPLLVSERGQWRAWVPEAATWPFELLVATTAGHESLVEEGVDRAGLAAILIDVLARLDQFAEGPMPYMLWIHQRPSGTEGFASQALHVHICPYYRSPGVPRFVASAELGGGLYFNPVDPLRAAATLREQPGDAAVATGRAPEP